jgi:hypothetical protein
MKQHLEGRRFHNNQVVKMAIHEWLKMQMQFRQSEGWDKCIKMLRVTLKSKNNSAAKMRYISRCKGFSFNLL